MNDGDGIRMTDEELDEILRRADERARAALARVLDTEGELIRVVAAAERRRSRGRSPALPAAAKPSAAEPDSGPVADQATSFWAELTEPERLALRAIAAPRVYAGGARLLNEGEPPTHVTVIESGWVKVTTATPDRCDTLLAVRGPGDIVGELGVFHGRPRSATVTALGPIETLFVPAEGFAAFLERHHHARRILTETITRRMEEAAAVPPPDMSARGIRRLAFLLVHLADQYGIRAADDAIDIRPRLSQLELANLVSASRQTIERTLRHWRDRGLIRTGWRNITVLAPGALRAIALGRTEGDRSVVFAAEIAEFTGRQSAREALHRLLATAFDDAGIPWDTCLREDREGGILAVTPTRTTAAGVGGKLLDQIQSGIRQYNLGARHSARIRLRVALHTGEVHRDEYGAAGPAVEHVLHLLDAQILREGLTTETDLDLIVSDPFYKDVTRHRAAHGTPKTFHQVTVEPPESRSPYWRRLSSGHPRAGRRAGEHQPSVRDLRDLLQREFEESEPRRAADRRGFVLIPDEAGP
jgi:CRP/FNR family cyclic AMP-dependent transcriptional regulator